MADTPVRIKIPNYHGRTITGLAVEITAPNASEVLNVGGDDLTQLAAGSQLFETVIAEPLAGEFDYVVLRNGNNAFSGRVTLTDTTEIHYSDTPTENRVVQLLASTLAAITAQISAVVTLVRGLGGSLTSSPSSDADASIVSVVRGTTWRLDLGEPTVAGWTKIEVTARKEGKHDQSDSLFHLRLSSPADPGDGLLVWNGASSSDATQGSVVESGGAFFARISEQLTQAIGRGEYCYDAKIWSADGVDPQTHGRLAVEFDVTRPVE